jgi:prepilin-type N-terminal cleavage/methylation domain-containing protein
LQIADCKLQIVERRGMTLIELLVAISILAILMAVGARMMRFSGEERRTREAARAVDVYISSARNRAMETGRPCGVMIRRMDGLPQCAAVLQQVEVPPPYAGDTLNATAQLQMGPVSGGLATVSAQLTPQINTTLVDPGDLVQFNHQGPMYEIVGPPQLNQLTLEVDVRQGQRLPWPDAPEQSRPVPFQIIRRPRKSAVGTLELPARTVIDLEASGIDSAPALLEGPVPGEFPPITIMFSPNGTVDQIHVGTAIRRVAEPVFLLIGKQERVPAGTAEDGLDNWEDLQNFYVTLNAQTGMVITTEVAKGDTLFDSRDFAREGQNIGGR